MRRRIAVCNSGRRSATHCGLAALEKREDENPFGVLQPSGTTLTTSSGVVSPCAIFIAPETRSGFMPSL